MEIIIIVNLITSLTILLGGCCMKKYASSPVDYTIGFKTKRSIASKEAWYFANNKCGSIWLAIGAAGFVLTLAAFFVIQPDLSSISGDHAQFFLLILQSAAIIFSLILTENQLKKKFNINEKK